jgi:penicillin-binding protein 1C
VTRWRRSIAATLAVICASAAMAAAAFVVLDRLFPVPIGELHREPAIVVSDRQDRPLRMFLPRDERWRIPVRMGDLPPELPAMLVALEDRWFFRHPGVNPLSIVRASLQNLRAGRVVSGASTIPMQIARMIEPKPRTLGGKISEAFRAVQLEVMYSKPELLEHYLNLAPFGGNIEGIGAAAWFYFGKAPDRLSLGETAFLLALPRAPNRFDPALHPEAARRARAEILARLQRVGMIPAAAADAARRSPIPASRRPVPMAAPHFTRMVASRSSAGDPDDPDRGRIRTTLDRHTQETAEKIVTRRIDRLRAEGIGNAAVVVLDNDTRAVRAMVGSAGFFESGFDGQVNGAIARRSPGSTLKPFLYALSFDAGTLVPDSFLLDVPTDFSGYIVENYDGMYRGRVTAREALAESLNSPAVRLLSRFGLEPFHRVLRTGGLITLDRPAPEYGLPLVLGAGEVTLLDLTNLYATLASGGRHRPVRVPMSAGVEPPGPATILISPEAARLVTEILTTVERPDLPAAWYLARGVPAVAWKTGTSFGHRDAWAIGYSTHHTIGVWVGNFDGRSCKGISGASHAGPVLFDLFRALGNANAGADDLMQRPPHARIRAMEVCALSHQRPGPFCPRRVLVDALPGRTRLPMCDYHRRVFVDRERGEIISGRCLGSRPHRTEILAVYPPELVAWWRASGRPVAVTRVQDPGCGAQSGQRFPRIVKPDPATPYRLRRDAPPEYQKVRLQARLEPQLDGDGNRLFWYQDGLLVAAGSPSEDLFLPLVRGEHRLVVVDRTGRSDSITYQVE